MAGSRRARAWQRAGEYALFAVAAVCFAWYGGIHIAAGREQAALSRELDRGRAATDLVPSAAAHPVPLPAPAPRALIARIDVPRLKLSALAREGVDTRTLRGSAGHVPGTAMPGEPGNAAFAAHRDTFFAPLRGVRKGDVITLTTPAGAFQYVVAATRVVDPEDVSVLGASSDPTLTLVTCYPFDYFGSAPQRFIVSARLVPGRRGV